MSVQEVRTVICFAFIIHLVSCGSGISVEESTSFLSKPSNGYNTEENLDSVKVGVQLWPSEKLALNDAFVNGEFNSRRFSERKNQLKKSIGFLVTIDFINKSFEKHVEDLGKLHYVIEEIKQDFTLKVDSKTYAPVLYHYERTFDLRKEGVFNLVFELEELGEESLFEFESKPLRISMIQARYNLLKLNNEFKIKY